MQRYGRLRNSFGARQVPALLALWLLVGSGCQAAISYSYGQTAYVVAQPQSPLSKRTLQALTGYIAAVLGKPPVVKQSLADVPAGQSAIVLEPVPEKLSVSAVPPANSPEAFAIASGTSNNRRVIVIAGATDRGRSRGVQRLITRSQQVSGGLEFPDLNIAEKPWIAEREWALTPWVPQNVRGVFVNPAADNRMDIFRYSDRQLANYVDMYDWFGFSGVQLLDTSYNYGVMGSPEAFQDQERKIAKLAHQNGQDVSLWVWAAEFTGYGWVDPSVAYTPQAGMTAFNDPKVRRTFEKYYDQYATLAPDVDRLIGHFYDPGRLTNRQDVFQYMRLLESKFRAKNPQIKMAIDSWAAGPDYLKALVDNGFSNYLLLEISMPSLFKPGQREKLHEDAKKLGLKMGVWGWYTTEYETDQLPSLYVNAKVLKHFYQQMHEGVDRLHPITYWSEMEANHLNDIFSMYASAQLLWNPDRDPDEILAEITGSIWGPKNGPAMLDAVRLIQDVRSGDSWDTYWWRQPGYRLGTDDPAQDKRRADETIAKLTTMETDATFVPKLPLPFPPATLAELMLPQLKQIRAFADFRMKLQDISRDITGGLHGQELSNRLSQIWVPIPEYNTWIGTFGQIEARMQETLIRKVAAQANVPVHEPDWVRVRDADRLLQKMQSVQSVNHDMVTFHSKQLSEFYWTPEKVKDRLKLLTSDGAIDSVGPDSYRLPNWTNFVQ